MKLIILAAGSGTRLRPYTDNLPKCMVPVNGRPLIEWLLDSAAAAGIKEIVIVKGYQANQLKLKENREWSRNSFVLNPDFATTNMVYSLWMARHEITEPVIISYADILYGAEVLDLLISTPEEISVVVDRNWRPYWEHRFDDPLSDAESLTLDADGTIASIGQEVSEINDIDGQYIGLMKFTGKGVDSLISTMETYDQGQVEAPRSFRQMYMTDLLQGMIDSGIKINPLWIDGNWVEIDSVKDLEIAETYIRLKNGRSENGLEIDRSRNTGIGL